jgi:transcriptional regulator GlxA family with amidase domain
MKRMNKKRNILCPDINCSVRLSLFGTCCVLALFALQLALPGVIAQADEPETAGGKVFNAGIVVKDQVYNGEIVAPYHIFQHTFQEGTDSYIRPILITPDGKPFTTYEGVRIVPDYSFDNAPHIDILVIPSTKLSMTEDLKNTEYIDWIKKTDKQASYVMSLCFGSFPLAATGALNGRTATTFPGEKNKFARMFPEIKVVRYGANFVVDGKYITSVGGHPSHEPALYLVEKLYSRELAKSIAEKFAMRWAPNEIPHIIVRQKKRNNERNKE